MIAQGVGMMALPAVALAGFRRVTASSPGPALAGAVAFVASQVVHLPLNFVVASFGPPLPEAARPWLAPLLLGASAGLCEESARWVSLRRNPTAAGAAATGLGHGGVESAILGVLVCVTAVQLLAVGDGAGLPPEAAAQLDAIRSAPDALSLLAFVERAFAMSAHLAMSMAVGLAVARRSIAWWLLAFAWHAALDAGAVAAAGRGALAAEAWVGAFAVLSWVLVFVGWRSWPAPPVVPAPAPPPPPVGRRALSAADALRDDLEGR